MTKRNSIQKMLSVIGMFVLIAAMALTFTGCGSNTTPETTAAQNAETVTFTVIVADLEGKETPIEVTTDKATVGEALLEAGVIEGDMGDYGLYINTVNGITADWDKDQTYWAFYINDEYAMTGVDMTEIDPDAAYSLVLTKG